MSKVQKRPAEVSVGLFPTICSHHNVPGCAVRGREVLEQQGTQQLYLLSGPEQSRFIFDFVAGPGASQDELFKGQCSC